MVEFDIGNFLAISLKRWLNLVQIARRDSPMSIFDRIK